MFKAAIARQSADIAFVTVSGIGGEAVLLDHLVFEVPEPATLVLCAIGLILLVGAAQLLTVFLGRREQVSSLEPHSQHVPHS